MLDTLRAFPTPEHIAFEYRLAGPLARAAAWFIDLLIRGGIFLVLLIPMAVLGADFAQGMVLVLLFALDWLSGGLCEWLWRGQTPGKRALGIQVIGVDGLPAGFAACMLRNLLRWADGFPYIHMIPTFGFGLVTLAATGRFQRLGDLAAGTLVIYVERRLPPRQNPPQEAAAKALLERLPPELPASLDGRTVRAIAAYVARRRQFHPKRRAEMAEHLAGALRRRFRLDAKTDADLLLVACYLALFPSGEKEASPGALAARVLARRRQDWLNLEGILEADRRAPSGVARALDLGRLYRSACTDLALAEAYHLPLPNQAYLHALVAQAHLRFYRRIRIGWNALLRLIFIDVPGRLYGDACLRIAFFAFFGFFVLCGLASWRNPELAVTFCGEETLLQLADSFLEPPRGRSTSAGAMMGGFYIFNNVGISLACFASGIFLGIGSLVWLVFNGIYLGCCFGWMAAQTGPERSHFLEFVSAHGPFELTGIALSGAAGLRLGLGLIMRQGLPMADALVRSAQQAMPIMAVAASFVALAAPIEGWISPSSLTVESKRIVMVLCTIILGIYLVVFGRMGRRALLLSEREAQP